jgi:hypothetical protein
MSAETSQAKRMKPGAMMRNIRQKMFFAFIYNVWAFP